MRTTRTARLASREGDEQAQIDVDVVKREDQVKLLRADKKPYTKKRMQAT